MMSMKAFKAGGWLSLGILLLAACTRPAALMPAPMSATASVLPTASATLAAAADEPATDTPVVPPTYTPEPPTATIQVLPSHTPTDAVTPTPDDTQLVETIFAPTATRGPLPTRTRRPTATPTITPTPTPPRASLMITRPGLLSKILSPYQMEAMVTRGMDGIVYLDLIGEDGRTVASQALDYRSSLYQRFWIAPLIDFEISGVAETARLVMSTKDEFGRSMAVSSVDLVLLSLGSNETTPSLIEMEPYLIRYPKEDSLVSGGLMWVSGVARPVNESPLILELVDEQGNVVGSNRIQVPAPTGDLSHTPFGVEIEYTVSEITGVRLVIRQESANRIPGTVALSSMTLFVAP